MKKLGSFETKSDLINSEVNLKHLNIGINSINNHIVVIDENKQIINVIDKICDHAGGKLIVKGDCAVCPMHGWRLDLRTMKYQDSHKI
jgi:CMP-N-acetylneuraminate monooxygenase